MTNEDIEFLLIILEEIIFNEIRFNTPLIFYIKL